MHLKRAVTEEIIDPRLDCPLQVSVSPIFDKHGKFIGGVHIARDITERKRAEEELLERERHSQSLLRLSRNLERAQTYAEAHPSQVKKGHILSRLHFWPTSAAG